MKLKNETGEQMEKPEEEAKSQSKSRRILFDPTSTEPFQLSRARLEHYLSCPRCFWLNLRLGVAQPKSPSYNLNIAVDRMVKNEFDRYRKLQQPHPMMIKAGIDGVPFNHSKLADWQETSRGKGMLYLHPQTNLLIMGAVDDIWLVHYLEWMLSVVDTKATSSEKIHPIEDDWWAAYRRQLEIYTWILDRMDTGYKVSRTAYFYFCNGLWVDREFNGKLDFEQTILTCQIDDSWVESAIISAHKCLMTNKEPSPSPDCKYCQYRYNTRRLEEKFRNYLKKIGK